MTPNEILKGLFILWELHTVIFIFIFFPTPSSSEIPLLMFSSFLEQREEKEGRREGRGEGEGGRREREKATKRPSLLTACWPTTPDYRSCPTMRLKCPASLHWRTQTSLPAASWLWVGLLPTPLHMPTFKAQGSTQKRRQKGYRSQRWWSL